MEKFASVILMPTLDHAARGSSVTPRCTKALAKSFRRVFRVFVLHGNNTNKRQKIVVYVKDVK